MRKYLFFILLFLLLGSFSFALAQEDKIDVVFFYSRTCPHCAQEKEFLEELEAKYSEIKINELEIYKNIELLKRLYKEYEVPSEFYGLVPATFIKDRYFIGFSEEISKEMQGCVLGLIDRDSDQVCGCGDSTVIDLGGKINLPIIGKIDIEKYSLSALAVLLGFLDGFNICSLGALILILGLVLALRSRKKTLIFGGLFILTTAVVYGLLIFLWYKIFSFLAPYLKIMEILIGLLAIGGGIYFLRGFIRFRKYGPTCEIGTGKGIIARFSAKFQESIEKSGNILLLIGSVLIFAGIITVVEFPCSAVVPVIFAGVLSQAQLPTFYYLLYIAIFVLFYMLDEIIIFLVAFFTMTIWLASSKAIIWITLAEAIILFILGFYYLFGFSAIL